MMMINIRRNVFETNSSSSHSISICQDSNGMLDTIACDAEGNITINSNYFGNEWVAYNSPTDKASYCVSYAKYDDFKLDMIREVIQDHTGCNEVIFNIDEGSYIDHQSSGKIDYVFNCKELLKKLLFDSKSYIFTGSDNSDPPPNFFDCATDIKYKYQLEVDGTDLVFKFQDIPGRKLLEEAISSIINYHPYNKYNNLDNFYLKSKKLSKFEFVHYDRTFINNIKTSSLTRVDQGVILLYKLKAIYEKKNHDNYIGTKILETKELFFKIVPINEAT